VAVHAVTASGDGSGFVCSVQAVIAGRAHTVPTTAADVFVSPPESVATAVSERAPAVPTSSTFSDQVVFAPFNVASPRLAAPLKTSTVARFPFGSLHVPEMV
jgi:hypothetical protein